MSDREPNPPSDSQQDLVKDDLGPTHFAPINPTYSSSFDESTGCDDKTRGNSPSCGSGDAEDVTKTLPDK